MPYKDDDKRREKVNEAVKRYRAKQKLLKNVKEGNRDKELLNAILINLRGLVCLIEKSI